MEFLEGAFPGDEHLPYFLTHEGADRAALLVHGFPGTPADVRAVGEVLYAQGWDVQGILLPGFGSQINTLTEYEAVDWSAAVQTALHELKQRYGTVLLVGYSLGGALALQVAAVHPPSALVLLAPFWKLNHTLWWMLPVLHRVLPSVPIFRLLRLDLHDPEVRAGITTLVPDADLNDPDVQQAVRNFRLPVRLFNELRRAGVAGYHAAPHVTVPALVLQGVQDDLVLPSLTRQLAGRLAGPVRYHEVEANHELPVLSCPAWDEIVRHILDFADIVT